MLERLQQETDLQRRRLIYGFPQQFASLRDVAVEFLTEVFRPSRLEARPLLRGAYFTSGTQDGTPIDRLLGAMAGQFGLQRQAVTAFSGAGRSYFLGRLMREVVFGEAGLVSLDPKVEKRQRITRIGSYAACGGGAAGLHRHLDDELVRQQGGDRRDARCGAALRAAIRRAGQARPAGCRSAGDPAGAGHAALDARAAMTRWRSPRRSTLTFGLYQGSKLSAAAIDAYDRALNGLLLPRLLSRLEAQMQSQLDKPEILYEALKVYLILGRQGPLDRELVEQWIGADFDASFPGDEMTETRDALKEHLHALLEYPLRALPLNGPLVAEVRAILTRQPLAEYVYNRMLRTAVVQSLPEWTIADNAGPAGGRVFELRDGKSLATGVPGIFTYDGYHTVFLTLLPRVTKDVTEDGWVLGRQAAGGLVGNVKLMGQLRRDILSLYLDDYTRRWDALLANVALKPFGNLQQGQDELFLLSAPDSPLRDLLTAVDVQTQLSKPAATDKALGKAGAGAAKVGQEARRLRELSGALGADAGAERGGRRDRLGVRRRGRGRRQAGRSGRARRCAFPLPAHVRRRLEGQAAAAGSGDRQAAAGLCRAEPGGERAQPGAGAARHGAAAAPPAVPRPGWRRRRRARPSRSPTCCRRSRPAVRR